MKANLKNFLFRNSGIKQTVIKNTFWLVLAEIIIKILSLILVIYVARILGAKEYGKFIFALSFASIISIVSDLGLMDIATREFSRNPENEKKFSSIFTLEMMLCGLAFVLAIISSFFITQSLLIRQVLLVVTLFVLTSSLFGVFFAFLRARQKMEYEALIKIAQAGANTIIVFLIIFFAPSVLNLSYGYFLSSAIVLLVLMGIFYRYFRHSFFTFDKKSLNILKISWPLSFGFMPGWTYMLINSIMLGYLGLNIQNGWYGAAYKIAIVTVIPANLIIKSFYPMLSKFFVESKTKLQEAWNYFAEAMIFLAVPLVVGGLALAPKIITTFYGRGFAPSVLALQYLVVIMAISFLNFPYIIALVIADRQKSNFWLTVAGAVVNTALNFIFIAKYGFYGVIFSSIIACTAVWLVSMALTWRGRVVTIFNATLAKALGIALSAALAMYVVIIAPSVYHNNVLLVCGLGALVYLAVLIFLYQLFIEPNIWKIR